MATSTESDGKRGIFRYFDGEQVREADSFTVGLNLERIANKDLADKATAGSKEAMLSLVTETRQVFGLAACLDIQNQQPNEGSLAFDFPLVSMLAEPLYWNI